MNLENTIKEASLALKAKNIKSHELDAQVILSDILGIKRESLITNNEISIPREVIEKYDDKTGFMAMEKWTGWHASIVMQKIMDGTIKKGAYPIEKALSGKDFYKEIIKRDYNLTIKEINTN